MITYFFSDYGVNEALQQANDLVEEMNKPKPKPFVPTMTPEYEEEYSAFSVFIGEHGRSYATIDEHYDRFETFRAKYREIKSHNEKYERGEVSYAKAINQFTDWTEEEFNERYHSAKLLKVDRSEKAFKSKLSAKPHLVTASHLPDYVNWYEQGKVSESIDQGGCGGCWAFTTATTLESLHAISQDLKEVPRYSVQYLLDCDEVDWACDGGWMADAYEFTAEKGIMDWEDYPRGYRGRKNACSDPGRKVKRYHNKHSNEEDWITNERMKELVSQQPVGVAMYSNFACLGNYSHGIVHDRDCNCSDADKYEVNHAVTVVGYGKSDVDGCDEYWLIKNSWGSYWGQNGLFKLCADRKGPTSENGACQVNSYVQWPSL